MNDEALDLPIDPPMTNRPMHRGDLRGHSVFDWAAIVLRVIVGSIFTLVFVGLTPVLMAMIVMAFSTP